jgi:VanZ family protein
MSRIGSEVQNYLRVVALVLLPVLLFGLFAGGAQPAAVGLIPAPWDKVAHAGLFAGFAVLIGLACGLLRLPRGTLLVLAFAGALAIGAADELHQATLPGRQAGWDDLAADALGALVGTWLLGRLGLVR